MWSTDEIEALRRKEAEDAERISGGLRDGSSALAHLPEGGFGILRRRRDPAVQAVRRRRREDAGLCPYCGEETGGDTVACKKCLARAAASRLRLRRKRCARGRCRCGAAPKPGYKLCEDCLGEAARRREANRAAGLCTCGSPATPGYATCSRCRSRAKARGAARAAAGLCLKCPAAARPGRRLCARCGEAAVKAQAERDRFRGAHRRAGAAAPRQEEPQAGQRGSSRTVTGQ